MTASPIKPARPPVLKLSRSRVLELALSLVSALSLSGAHVAAQGGRKPSEQPRARKPAADGERKSADGKRAAAPVCDQQRALALVEQQVAEARSFEPSAQQITVMIRAADLLWPYKREQARAVFAEAFDLAAAYFRQRGDETASLGRGVTMHLPDQRFMVLRAVSKRDAAWARRLAEQVAEESRRAPADAAAAAEADEQAGLGVGQKLIGLAISMLEVDREAAVRLARTSFGHPASLQQPSFFFELSKLDQGLADDLYRDALVAYGGRGRMHDLGYLSVYPFALNHPLSPVKTSTYYEVPAGFKQNPAVQEAFVKTLLARAETVIASPDQFNDDRNPYYWETTQAVAALASLEPLAAARLPAYSERVAEVRARAEVAAGERGRQNAEGFLSSQRQAGEARDFDAQADKAEAQADPDRRDQAITFLSRDARAPEQLARLESLAAKVSDASVRRQLLDWVSFNRALRLAKDGLFDEARRSADRVGELDLRAVLYFEIGRESLKRLEDKARARELLDAVAEAAAKSPHTDIKARTQFGVVHLFAGFDGLRALEVAADAVKTVNALDKPDLARSFVARRIEGKTFSTYSGYNVPGFSLENAFRELGPHDFEGTLLTARNLSDRALRATAVVGLAAHCLEQPAEPAPDKPPVPKGAKP
jgi:hypothetical protein